MSRANPDETPTKNRYQRDARLARTLTPLSNGEGAYCLAKGTVPAGVVVPIHNHDERESVYVPEGQIEALWEDHWIPLRDRKVYPFYDVSKNPVFVETAILHVSHHKASDKRLVNAGRNARA